MTTINVQSPFDGHLIGTLPITSEGEAKNLLANAHKAYENREAWLSPEKRKAILTELAVLLEKDRDGLAKKSAEEGGKPLMDSLVEADRAINGVKVAISWMDHMTGSEIPMNLTASSANRMAYTYREPKGVVFSISAFNHPINLIIHQVIPAVAVGCPVLVKPATTTPFSCFRIVELLHEAGLPPEWCQAFVCENSVAEKIVTDSRISFLSFIGSAKVGWYLRSKLPPGANCALEHGGAAPVIIEADADLEAALPLLLKAAFYHAGQVCVSAQRIFAHHKIAKSFAKKLADGAKKLKVGDPVDPTTEVGPIISKKEVERIDKWVQEAIYKGAKLMCGGAKISETTFQPTVLLDPPQDTHVSQEEIFGPVVCVYSYKDRNEAIDLANAPPFFFQGSVFTKNIDVALDTVKRLHGTTILVNDHPAFRVDWMPFGGRRHSGLGMGGIPYSMMDMTFEKMMVIKSDVL